VTSAQEPRPPLGSWARAYALVIVALLVEIVLMWLLTERHR
jgi:hypothetical protein